MASSSPNSKSKSGQSLIELLIAMALAAILLPALMAGLVLSRQGRPQTTQRTAATALLREAEESVRSLRARGWSFVSTNPSFHTYISGSAWALASGSEVINGYTRSIKISDVSRASGKIVTSGGTLDPSTKLVTITVSWTTPYSSSVSTNFYLTRYRDNIVWIQTSIADFTAGVFTKTAVEATNGSPTDGQVVLSGGGKGDWCQPSLTLATVDLPKNGVANALTAIPATDSAPGYAFAGTGDNASGVSFARVDIADTDPPTAFISGTFDGFKTNGIFGEPGYAYLATDNHTKEIEIIDLNAHPYSEAGWFDAPGNGNGNAISVFGSIGYMISANKFYTFNLSSKSGDRGLPLNNNHVLTLAGTGTKIQVNGSYAYVSTTSSSTQLQIINISDPTNPTVVGQAVNVNDQGATDVYINDSATRAYLVTSASAAKPELFVIDISSKSGNQPVLAGFDTAGMSPKGVVAVTNNKVIVVGTGGTEYQVFNYDDTNKIITRCPNGTGLLNIDTGINGIASVIQPSGSVFSYIITGDSTSELKIIEGGPSGKTSSSGTFESAIFDSLPTTGNPQTFFNRLSFTANINPPTTVVQFQVAIAAPVNGSCTTANYVYVGPNGTGGTYFTSPGGAIPPSLTGTGYLNPAQCFRFKAYLSSTDHSSTPILNDVTVNYSP